MLPNFLVVGAQKSGTTSLHHYLQAHPDIYLPAQKETKFFVHEKYYCKGTGFYENEYFYSRNNETAVGEVDPDYLYYEGALPRIAHDLDLASLKLIFIFRNPVERAFSHYLMSYRRGQEPHTFEEAIETESVRIAEGHMENLRYSYVSRGYYLRQVERFLGYVDRSQMLFLLADDLEADPSACLQQVYTFLGVASDFVPSSLGERFHRATVPRSLSLLRWIKEPGSGKQLLRLLIPFSSLRQSLRAWLLRINQTNPGDLALNPETRKRLVELYRSENARLAAFLDRDLDHWNHLPDSPGRQS
ncbi:sulfotransferase domain-containing protein [Thiogranum longum]|uniref:Sulfotransferase domain-containing protein n=1 Tax=Thiogranum longum TaxID=1537524 RepID=A0A4R1H8J8_9GAMM|nr:sulfotransferase [Thiogranum longum]TCK18164.1 sulfotransferase domain-containing protein [Thiogranum longum]